MSLQVLPPSKERNRDVGAHVKVQEFEHEPVLEIVRRTKGITQVYNNLVSDISQ